MSTTSNKRENIQWLRALAIIAVLCFHLWPEIFPYGYRGVDIFFVLSGYLMTMILSRKGTILSFYLSRIKRIFPVCLFAIMAFLICGYFVLQPSHFEFLKSEALWSILFVNNFPSILHKKQYFELISDFKFFLHTWSLGVEIQFYLMAPFFIKFLTLRKAASCWIMAVITLSWLLQTFISNDEFAFGFVFCRIWQFMIGTFAYNAAHKFKEYHARHDASWLRVKEASKHCTKCKLIPTEHLFCKAGFCSIVDEVTKVSKYCDPAHITPKTSLKLTPLFLKAIDEID